MEPIKRKNNEGKGFYLVAAIFIAVGLLLLGRNLGIIDSRLYHLLVSWKTLLVVLGCYFLIRKQFLPGIIMVGIGGYFIMRNIQFFNDKLNAVFWPAILIAIGIYFLLKRSKVPDIHHRPPKIESSQYSSTEGFLYSENSFSAIQQTVIDEVFRGGVIKNSFGSTDIDLRRTSLPETPAIIDIHSNFGGIELHVPSNWNVITEISVFLGGVEDSRIHGLSTDPRRTLILRGNISFGGLEIKS